MVAGSPWTNNWESNSRSGSETIEFEKKDGKLIGKITDDSGGHSTSSVGKLKKIKIRSESELTFRSARGTDYKLTMFADKLTRIIDGGNWEAKITMTSAKK